MTSPKRQYGYALLAGAVGAGLILLALRAQWAQAVFTPQKPLTAEVVNVSGTDLVPLAEALALAALAGLIALVATRGVARRIVGALLALFGAGAGAAVLTGVTAATVVSVAVGKVASPESAALSGTGAGSTTSGSSGNGAIVVSNATGHAIIGGTPWQAAVIVGALLVFAAGLATALRGQDWPAMSARYDAPGARGAAGADAAVGTGSTARKSDAASMWESLNGGEDPTEDDQADQADAATRR